MTAAYADSVFLNCPFDDDYRPFFRAIVFTIHDAGFVARCALEISDATQDRLTRIASIVEGCRYGIHDISRTEVGGSGLPRFNMPFELGLFMGSKRYGGRKQRGKSCLVLDREPYRYQRFLSDISGSDIESHDGRPEQAVGRVRDWLRTASKRTTIPGGKRIWTRYERFIEDLAALCTTLGVDEEDLSFPDYSNMVVEWLREDAG